MNAQNQKIIVDLGIKADMQKAKHIAKILGGNLPTLFFSQMEIAA